MTEHTINAAGKKLGRVASEAAKALMGKMSASYRPNAAPQVSVTITGAGALDMSDRKRSQKTYHRYSGHPGGQKTETLEEVIAAKGAAEALRRAVYGMLPANKLRAPRMKQLTINE